MRGQVFSGVNSRARSLMDSVAQHHFGNSSIYHLFGLHPISWSSDKANYRYVCSECNGSLGSSAIGSYLEQVAANSAGVMYPNELCGPPATAVAGRSLASGNASS